MFYDAEQQKYIVFGVHMTPMVFYGIIIGCCVYIITITVVLVLLVKGGSFRRIFEQQQKYDKIGSSAFKAPALRPVLYDELIFASQNLPLKPLESILNNNEFLQGFAVKLRILNKKEDISDLFQSSNGTPRFGHGNYDPEEVIWRFLSDGPFENETAMRDSIFFEELNDNLHLCVVDLISDRLIGTVSLINNHPKWLTIEIGNIWFTPAYQKTVAFADTIHLLLNTLFQQRYRRIQLSMDIDHLRARKGFEQLGFTYEGTLRKERVIRNCNQDTAVYSILNSDWENISTRILRVIQQKISKLPSKDKQFLEKLSDKNAEGKQVTKNKNV